jgi:small subunit ribosomal protein S20
MMTRESKSAKSLPVFTGFGLREKVGDGKKEPSVVAPAKLRNRECHAPKDRQQFEPIRYTGRVNRPKSKGSSLLANTKSAIKHVKTSERKRLRNRAVKTTARTFVRRAREAINDGSEDTAAALTGAIQALDKAAQKGVIHRNNAARRKSRLVMLHRSKQTT